MVACAAAVPPTKAVIAMAVTAMAGSFMAFSLMK
jgi:hypothetical protein